MDDESIWGWTDHATSLNLAALQRFSDNIEIRNDNECKAEETVQFLIRVLRPGGILDIAFQAIRDKTIDSAYRDALSASLCSIKDPVKKFLRELSVLGEPLEGLHTQVDGSGLRYRASPHELHPQTSVKNIITRHWSWVI